MLYVTMQGDVGAEQASLSPVFASKLCLPLAQDKVVAPIEHLTDQVPYGYDGTRASFVLGGQTHDCRRQQSTMSSSAQLAAVRQRRCGFAHTRPMHMSCTSSMGPWAHTMRCGNMESGALTLTL